MKKQTGSRVLSSSSGSSKSTVSGNWMISGDGSCSTITKQLNKMLTDSLQNGFTSYVDLEDIQRKLWLMIVNIANVNGEVQVG
jgi:hypothetical protein